MKSIFLIVKTKTAGIFAVVGNDYSGRNQPTDLTACLDPDRFGFDTGAVLPVIFSTDDFSGIRSKNYLLRMPLENVRVAPAGVFE